MPTARFFSAEDMTQMTLPVKEKGSLLQRAVAPQVVSQTNQKLESKETKGNTIDDTESNR